MAGMKPESEQDALEQYETTVKQVYYRHYRRPCPGLDKEDLLQSGRKGIITAYRTFEESKGTAFSTWVRSQIRGSMGVQWTEMDYLPAPVRRDLMSGKEAVKDWHKPAVELGALDNEGAHMITDDREYPISFDSGELKRFCSDILDDRYWDMLYRRVGLKQTFRAIGEVHKLSKERVRQIVVRALRKIKKKLKSHPGGIYGTD